MWENLSRFELWALLCILVGLFLSLRSFRGMLLPALTVSVSLTLDPGNYGAHWRPPGSGSSGLAHSLARAGDRPTLST